MFSVAIILIILIVLGAAYLIAKESNSEKANKNYGKIIAAALLGILVVVVYVGYMFITYFK